MQKILVLSVSVISLMMPNLFSSELNQKNISSYHFVEKNVNLNGAHNAVLDILTGKPRKWGCVKPNVDKLLAYVNYKNSDPAFSNCAVKVLGYVFYKYSADVWKTYASDASLGKEFIKIQGYNMARKIRNDAGAAWKYLEDMIPEIQ